MSTKDPAGDRCKELEMVEAGRRAAPGLPLLARLDGRAFHTFTSGLRAPFDDRFRFCMVQTASHLMADLDAAAGYTQSDEITLAWHYPPGSLSEFPFGGRWQKLASVLASVAAACFGKHVAAYMPEKAHLLPSFDCRVWQVPTVSEALDVFAWREADAVKNSVSMAAQAHFSHKALHGVGTKQMLGMLREAGRPWENLPSCHRRGTYLRHVVEQRELSAAERERIPERHRPQPGHLVMRGRVAEMDLPPAETEAALRDLLCPATAPSA